MSFHTITYNNQHQIGAGQDMSDLSQTGVIMSRSIFVNNGEPMLFYIYEEEPMKLKYKQLITQHGGQVTEHDPRNEYPNIMFLASKPIKGRTGYLTTLIENSVARGHFVDPYDYGFDLTRMAEVSPMDNLAMNSVAMGNVSMGNVSMGNEDMSSAIVPTNGKTRGHNKYNADKDKYILEKVRMNPRMRHSQKFFQGLATHDMLRGHTGNSIRSRFLKQLEHKLDYVFLINSRGEVEKDENGNPIRLSPHQFPSTLKNKFSAEDDYRLCCEAREYIKKKDVEDYEESKYTTKFALDYTFFSGLFKKYPNHPLHSWRDRYRKHFEEGTIPNYIDSFEQSMRQGRLPAPLRATLAHNKKRDHIKAVMTSNRFRDEDSALDEEIGEVKSSNIDDALKPQSGNMRSGRKQIMAPTLDTIGTDDDDDSQTRNVIQNHLATQIEAHTDNVFQSLGQPQEEDLDDKYSTANEDESYAVVEGIAHQMSQLQAPDEDTQYESQLAIRYVPKDVTITDIFDHPMFDRFDKQDLHKARIRAAINKSENSIEIFQNLGKEGCKEMLVSHALMSTNCNLDVMQIYFDHFFELCAKLFSEGNVKRIYTIFRMPKISGVWDSTQDLVLGTPNEKLLHHQGAEEIVERKKFLRHVPSMT